MCVKKTLAEGRLQKLIIGLGWAADNLLYCGIVAFGIAAISSKLIIIKTGCPLVNKTTGVLIVVSGIVSIASVISFL